MAGLLLQPSCVLGIVVYNRISLAVARLHIFLENQVTYLHWSPAERPSNPGRGRPSSNHTLSAAERSGLCPCCAILRGSGQTPGKEMCLCDGNGDVCTLTYLKLACLGACHARKLRNADKGASGSVRHFAAYCLLFFFFFPLSSLFLALFGWAFFLFFSLAGCRGHGDSWRGYIIQPESAVMYVRLNCGARMMVVTLNWGNQVITVVLHGFQFHGSVLIWSCCLFYCFFPISRPSCL